MDFEIYALAKKYTDKKVSESGGGSSTDYSVEITESTSESYAKVYSVKQGGNVVGTINIPKDMVIQSGQIVENPTGQVAGQYLELTLANSESTKIYIAVSDLVDVYTAQSNATQIQLSISSGNVISAKIVAGSVGETELSTTLKNTLNTYSLHISKTIASEEGAHGLRYYNGALEYNDNGTWKPLSISNLMI